MRLTALTLPAALALALLPPLSSALRADNGAPLTVLHTFGVVDDSEFNLTNTEGAFPIAKLLQASDGSLYGTTGSGGSGGSGTVFQITPGGTLSVLHTFDSDYDTVVNNDGDSASALTQGSDGNFYGTTFSLGPNGSGTVFRLTPAGVLTNLHSFPAADGDGESPASGVTRGSDGFFYGTTTAGGVNGKGTIFRIATDGTLTVLHDFTTTNDAGDNIDGVSPMGALPQGSDGNFYGVAYEGGFYAKGTIFRLSIQNGTASVATLHTFGGANDGANPSSELIQAKDGNFYCTTRFGGANGTGIVYRLTVTGSPNVTVLHTFNAIDFHYANSDGARPETALAQGSDGNFYGVTRFGGANGTGTIFRLVLTGSSPTLTVIHTFSTFGPGDGEFQMNSEGANPVSALLQAKDGNFYGGAAGGGANGTGTLFKINILNPVITSAKTASGTVGQPFSYQISATNTPTSYGAAKLPPGLSINPSTGLISGKPTQAGTFTSFVGAFNNSGSGGATLSITIKSAPAVPVITSATSAAATTGEPFNYQIAASGSPTKYGAANLPPGLTINQSTGAISGTPTRAGAYTVTIAAFNAAGSGSAKLTITVKLGAPVITSEDSGGATTGEAYSYQITATNSPTKYGASGLPANLKIDQTTGLISGLIDKVGTYTVTVAAFNATGSGSLKLTLTVFLGKPVITSPTTATAIQGKPFSYQITATGSPTKYGEIGIPAGLKIDQATGLISGTVSDKAG